MYTGPKKMSDGWYYQIGGQIYGPLTVPQLLQQAKAGVIRSDVLVRKGDSGQWFQALQIKGLIATPPPMATKPTSNETDAWYYSTDCVHGPVSGEHLLQLMNAGQIQTDTWVCNGNGKPWLPAADVTQLIKVEIPKPPTPTFSENEILWYYQTDRVYGPVTTQQLLEEVNTGVIQSDTPVCKGNAENWTQASQVAGLITIPQGPPIVAPPITPPPLPSPLPRGNPTPRMNKSRTRINTSGWQDGNKLNIRWYVWAISLCVIMAIGSLKESSKSPRQKQEELFIDLQELEQLQKKRWAAEENDRRVKAYWSIKREASKFDRKGNLDFSD